MTEAEFNALLQLIRTVASPGASAHDVSIAIKEARLQLVNQPVDEDYAFDAFYDYYGDS